MAVAVVWRAPGFAFSEVNWDERLYLLIADSVAHGALPYAAVWDRKPAGLFYLLGAIRAATGGDGVALRLLPACGLGLGTWSLAALVRRLAAGPGAGIGGVVAGLLWLAYAGRADGGGLNTEVLFVPLNLAALVLLLRAGRVPGLMGAGVLMGVAFQIKYNAAFTCLAFPFIWRGLRGGWPRWGPVLAGAALPTLAVLAPFLAAGRLDLWWEANVGGNIGVLRDAAAQAVTPWRLVTGDPGYMALRYAVPLAAGLLALAGAIRPAGRVALGVAAALTLADGLALVVLGRFTDHMMIQLLPGPCLAAGCLAAWLWRGGGIGRAGLALLLGIAAARDGRGFADPFVAAGEIAARRWAGEEAWGDPAARAARIIAGALRPGDGLYVFGGPILGLYAETGRVPPTRFPFAEHLWKPYAPAPGAEEMRRILAGAPRLIAVSAAWRPGQPPPEPAAAPSFAALHAALAAGYAEVATVSPFRSRRGGPIGPRETIVIFRRLASPMAAD